MATPARAELHTLVEDLQTIFGPRLHAVVAYGRPRDGRVTSLVLVTALAVDDLAACAARVGAWHRAGAATPLIQTREEFARSLDAFPVEYSSMMAAHQVIVGADPFAGLAVSPGDLRRALEVQAKSHLLHLREDYLECGGRPRDIGALVAESAPAFAALLGQLARLDGVPAGDSAGVGAWAASHPGLDARVVGDVLALAEEADASAVDAARLYPDYLLAMERLARYVDEWGRR